MPKANAELESLANEILDLVCPIGTSEPRYDMCNPAKNRLAVIAAKLYRLAYPHRADGMDEMAGAYREMMSE
jgi:hypothetical protein